jgi:hypothetical protein
MTEAIIDPNYDSNGRWVVEFTELRVRNEHQRDVAESLDRRALSGILEIWLKIVVPGATIVDPLGTAACSIVFPNRAASRKFCSRFGGKLKSRSSA